MRRKGVQKGFTPNMYLSNVSVAYIQSNANFIANTIFPTIPVNLQSSYYYKFDKGDLLRDEVQRKPRFGKVSPALMGKTDDFYRCEVDQVIVGIDQFDALNYASAPGMADPKKAKAIVATQKMLIHMDRMWAEQYFKSGVWTTEKTGVAANPGADEFLQFDNANSDPIKFFKQQKRWMHENTGFMPNVLVLGGAVYDELTEHPDIVERVKYTQKGIITADILASLFDVQRIVVPGAIYNAALPGEADNIKYICGKKDALFAYANPSPAIDQPSAGYTFVWDGIVPGAGLMTALDTWEGEPGTHSEFVEGLMASDMKKVSQDLAVFMQDCVA